MKRLIFMKDVLEEKMMNENKERQEKKREKVKGVNEPTRQEK